MSVNELSSASRVSRIRRFLSHHSTSTSTSTSVVSAFVVTFLLSSSIGLTVGIVPEVLTDRYARLDHGYGDDDNNTDDYPPCWHFDTDTMPSACTMGADNAQTGSAYAMFVQNLMTFFFNALIGSYSDKHGRRGPLLVSLFLNTLLPAALVAMESFESMNPFWYYAADASIGSISYTSMIFAMLSDGCPEELRSGRFAVYMAGYYLGLALSPKLAVVTEMSHIAASWCSLGSMLMALGFTVFCLPETLPSIDGGNVEASEAALVAETNEGNPAESLDRHERDPLLLADEDGDPRREEGHISSPVPEEESAQELPPGCCKATATLLLRPLREMTILKRDHMMVLVAVASLLSAAVYNTDKSLIFYYIEEHLNVREADMASMFFCMGLLGATLQGIGIQPLVNLLSERGLLVVCFCSGTIHNLLYGIATSKTEIYVALSLSQVTKLGYPILSSLASQKVGVDEQGRVQGALLALNALAGSLGPVSMNWIYTHTKDSTSPYVGPGTMFLLAAGLYGVGTGVVSWIYYHFGNGFSSKRRTANSDNGRDLEEPLLLQLGEESSTL